MSLAVYTICCSYFGAYKISIWGIECKKGTKTSAKGTRISAPSLHGLSAASFLNGNTTLSQGAMVTATNSAGSP